MTGLRLDLGCGKDKLVGWTGVDLVWHPGVDVVHDLNERPWPFEDESIEEARAHHVIEHIPKVQIQLLLGSDQVVTFFPFIDFMDEVHRILIPGGRFTIWYPPGGSQGYYQDPTHCSGHNKNTWLYFDPMVQDGFFFRIYKPKPWKIVTMDTDELGNDVIVLEKTE